MAELDPIRAEPMDDSLPSAALLSGDLGILQRYLEMQFDRQNQLLLDLSFAVQQRPIVVRGASSRMTTHSNHSMGSQVEHGRPSETSGLALELPETKTRDLEDQLELQPGEMIHHPGPGLQRDSSRASFVRHATLDHHVQAQRAATRIEAARRKSRKDHLLMEQSNNTWRAHIKRFVLSSRVGNFVMAMIIFNAILLGWEIDVSAQRGTNDIPSWFGNVNTALVLVFVAETSLKLFALGCDEFWRGDDWIWNAFDFIIVSIAVAETGIDYWAQSITTTSSSSSNSFRIVRSLRLVRTLRGLRIIRVFRYFSALRALILSIFSTMGSLLWTLLLLLILFYTFGCIFTQLVTDHCRFLTIVAENDVNATPQCPELLAGYWGNMVDSMVTLFMSITGGINWEEAYTPLKEVSLLGLWLMNLYIVIGFFTILNVVTGVFVNTAIESASADKDIATLKQMEKRNENMAALREVFREVDQTSRMEVSIEDLEQAFSENKLSTFMESLGISTDDVWGLFCLLDADHNGAVDLDEFVNGCMQLRGPAKSLQIAKMSFENKVTRQALKALTEQMKDVKLLLLKQMSKTLVKEHL